MITELRHSIGSFISRCDKPTLFVGIIMMSRLLGFIHIPPILIYAAYIIYATYIFCKSEIKFYIPLLLFVLYIPIQLLITEPDIIFKSWERYALFILLMICVSPLIKSRSAALYRHQLFQIAVFFCVIIGIGSFFARFLGINFMNFKIDDYVKQVGLFGGLTTHSMLLGPVAGIGVIYCIYQAFISRQKLYWCLAIFCMGAVMFSASRIALMATIIGSVLLIYKISKSKSSFIKYTLGAVVLASLTFPLWGRALDGVIAKNESNVSAGSAYSSRDVRWAARLLEFESSPLFGVGFDAIDLNLSMDRDEFDPQSGMVESGTSWLIILSMTGIIGAILLFPVLFGTYQKVLMSQDTQASLLCGLMTFFFIHMIAEGYIFYAGGQLAYLLWLTIGVARDFSNRMNLLNRK